MTILTFGFDMACSMYVFKKFHKAVIRPSRSFPMRIPSLSPARRLLAGCSNSLPLPAGAGHWRFPLPQEGLRVFRYPRRSRASRTCCRLLPAYHKPWHRYAKAFPKRGVQEGESAIVQIGQICIGYVAGIGEIGLDLFDRLLL